MKERETDRGREGGTGREGRKRDGAREGLIERGRERD